MSEIRENKEQLNGMIQKIGNLIVPVLTPGWLKVVMGYFVEESGVTHLQLFEARSGEEDYTDLVALSWDMEEYDDAIVEIQDVCAKMYELCKCVGDEWSAMSFVLNNDGTYNVDYAYDIMEPYDSGFILEWQSIYLD